MMKTMSGGAIDSALVNNYFNGLVGMYFKILPLYEKNEKSLMVYMENLRDELEGCKNVISAINDDPMYLSLISVLQYLIDSIYSEDFTTSQIKQKVFGAISVCKKLAEKYGEADK